MEIEYRGHTLILDDDGYGLFTSHVWQLVRMQSGMKLTRPRTITRGRKGKRTTILFHRELMGFPEGLVIDHINHNTLDNRKENLRICSQMDNMKNRLKSKNKNGKYKGVYWQEKSKNWVAMVISDKKRYYLGRFTNQEDAYEAYCKKAFELHGEFANLG